MTPTTPREALENSLIRVEDDNSFLGNMPETIDAILTALAPFMRTQGTVEVCKPCAGYIQINQGDCGDGCPIKQVTK